TRVLYRQAIVFKGKTTHPNRREKRRTHCQRSIGRGTRMSDAAAIARGMLDKVNARDIDGFREMLHSEYTYCGPGGVEHEGADVGVAVVTTFTTAFPDLKLMLTHQYTDGDVSILEFRATGTHQAELEGIAPTGKSVTVDAIDVVTVRDGRVVSE